MTELFHPKSKQFIENTLIAIKKDLVVLSVEKPSLTDEIQVLIERTERYLLEIIELVDQVYGETTIDQLQALRLYNLLLEILFDDFDKFRLVEIIESDIEDEIISNFRNQFIQLIREIENEL